MTLKLNGTNSVAAPAYAGDDADTGLQCGTNELKLVTGGSARATVDSSGRIGLDATPTAQFTGHSLFQIGAQASLGANQALSTTGQTFLTHNLYFDTSGNYQVFNTSNANEGSIIQLVDGSIRFRTSAATTGTPSVGERVRIDANGLKFNGDQADANALDDYEEGDWTPTITFNGNNSGMSFSSRDGFYIRIGRQITCWVQCTLTSKGSSTGTARLSGLPFDVGSELNNTSIEGGGLMVYAANIQGTIRGPYCFAPENGQNHCEIYGSPDSNEQSTNLTSTYFENNTLFRGYFTYFAS